MRTRNLFLLAALLLLAPLAAKAQVFPAPPNVGPAASRPVNCVASNPGQPQEPQWYFATDTSVLSICVATNTWQNTTGGGGGGIGGGGTAGFLGEWTNGTTIGNSLCQDSSSVLICSESISVGSNAFMISKSNSASGTTQFLAVAWDAARNAITALPGNSVRGIAGNGAGTSGTVQIAIGGEYPWICDNQTTVNDWLILSTTTAGECHDAGPTEPTGVQNIAQVSGANTGSGTATLADIFTPDTANAPAGPPTIIQVNGSPLASTTANFNSSSPAAPSNYLNLPFATDGLSPSGVSLAAPLATASQPGLLQLSTDLGGSDIAPNVVGIQGIPCTLNGTPVAGQVWGFTSPTACSNLYLGVAQRTYSIATDTILSTDRESWVRPTHSGTVATTLPQAGTTGFTGNFTFGTLNFATGTDTITPTTSTINGGASLAVLSNWFALTGSDNTNYFAAVMPTALAFPSCADSAGNHLNFTSSGGITCGSTSSGSGVTSVGMTVPGGFSISGSPITSSGTLGLTTNAAGADYVFTSTAANTSAWEQVNGGSSCGDSTHAVSYSTSTHLFGCQAISASGGITSINTSATGPAVTIQGAGSTNVNTSGNTITISGINGPPSPNVQSISSAYTVQNSDNSWRDVFTGSSAIAVTLPQAGQISAAPFVATRFQSSIATCSACATSSFTQSAGDTLFVVITGQFTQTVSSVTDSAGDTFALLTTSFPNFDTFGDNLYTYIATGIAASASNVVTVHLSATTSIDAAVLEYTAMTSDHQASASITGTPPLTASVPVSYTSAVALGFVSASNTPTCSASYTSRASISHTGVCELLLSSVSNVAYSSSGSNYSAINLASFGVSGQVTFAVGWYVVLENASTNIVTVTPTTSTINGQTTLKLVPNEICAVMSNGTNYDALCSTTPNRQTNGVIGQPVEISGVNTSATSTDVSTTTLITTGAANAFYNVQAGINCTTSTSGAVETLTVTYTDTSSTVQTATAQVTCTTLGTASIASINLPFRAKASTNIQYGTAHTTAQATYDVSVAIYQLATN